VKTVLIVESDKNIREMVAYGLSQFGCETFTASNAEEASKLMKENPLMKVALVDLVTPEMAGEDTCLMIKNQYPGTFLIVTSAYLNKEGRKRLYECNINNIINKPYQITTLANVINGL
jgi:DNA-binding response OmpR family regulator